MGKQSLESLIGYRDQGWKFYIKKVKGKLYITIKQKNEVKSLGPYTDEVWRLIGEITDGQTKETEGQSPTLGASSRAAIVEASEAVVALKVVKAIKAFGGDVSESLSFIEEIYKEAMNQDLAPKIFVNVAKGLHEIKVEGQRDYLALEGKVLEMKHLSESLVKKASEYEEEAKTLSKANEAAERKLGETSILLKSKDELAGKVREAEDLGLRPSQLGAIVETARKAGSRHGLSINDSINWLVKDLEENWEPKLGFENEKTRLAVELDQLHEKIKLAEDKEKVTQEKVRAQEEALRGLDELKKQVSAGEIIEFKKLIVDGGFEVSTFRSEVERLGSVTATVNLVKQSRETELAKLEGRVTALSAQVAQLMNSKVGLEDEINILNSEAIKGIREASKTIMGVAEGLKLDFEAPDTGYKATIQSLGKEATKEMDEEIKRQRGVLVKSVKDLDSLITRSASEVKNLKKSTWDVGKHIGFNVHLTRLAKIVAGEPVEKVEALSTIKMVVDAFTDYLTRNRLADRCPSASRFSSELRSMIV